MEENQWVIIGDLIKSRKIINRQQVQENLETILWKVNFKYRKIITMPFTITLGDQFVGAVSKYNYLLELLWNINNELEPIRARYGIGFGTIEFQRGNSNIKGTGYTTALRSVQIAKKSNFKVHLAAEKGAEKHFLFIDSFLLLFFKILSNYNQRQNFILYQAAKGQTQSAIAQLLQTSQSSISQSLTNINWVFLIKAFQKFKQLPKLLAAPNQLEPGSPDYIALIGSWNTGKQNEEEITALLERLNFTYKREISSQFVLTSPSAEQGQFYEFQGLLSITSQVNPLMDIITDFFINIDELYLGLGAGGIKTAIKEIALGMDGTSFHLAREALNDSLADRIKINFLSPCPGDNFYSILLGLFVELINSWTDRQVQAINFKRQGLIQEEIKEKMNLNSRSTVAEHLKRAGWFEYHYSLKQLSKMLYHLINGT